MFTKEPEKCCFSDILIGLCYSFVQNLAACSDDQDAIHVKKCICCIYLAFCRIFISIV